MKYLGLHDDGMCYAAPREYEFIFYYEKNWAEILADTYYKCEQLDVGHKFRPRLVYWGFTINGTNDFTDNDFNQISKIAVSIELIHKASLLLDDFIDKDTARHGKPTFHTIYGVDRTVIYSLNILSLSLRILNDTFYEYSSSNILMWKSMTSLTSTLQDMTLGVLKELDLPDNFDQHLNQIKDIMNLETSSLITTSLLAGIYMAGVTDNDILSNVKSIGTKFGFIFQGLNDLEPFCSVHNAAHKGSINTDFSRNRKNICISILYQLITTKEKYKLDNGTSAQNDTLLLELFRKYSIYSIIMNEIDNVLNSIQADINALKNLSSLQKSIWPEELYNFVLSTIEVCKNRLN